MRLLLALCVLIPTAVRAETIPVSAVAQSSAVMFEVPNRHILRAADRMPEADYGFRPTPEVRSYGEVLAHIADGHRLICSIAAGDERPANIQQTEKTKTTKAEIVAALKESIAYCEDVHKRLSGATGAEVIDFFGKNHARVNLLAFASSHAWEHYGNLVTYLRLKGIVPPSSEPRP